MISIIIPTCNSEKTIKKLLDSIFNSSISDEWEVLVVDDASSDCTVKIVSEYPVRLIKKEANTGSACSRNLGVKQARGDIIIFFDSDVILQNDTLKKLIEKYRSLSGALIGIYSKQPANKCFVSQFKGYLDYHHWQTAKSNIVTSFEPRCSIIQKSIFQEVGGFNEKIKGAGVEDFDFGYKLMENNLSIHVRKDIQVYHHFPDKISTLCSNFFLRGSGWFELFLNRQKFDNVGCTQTVGLSCAFAFLSLLFFIFQFLTVSISIYPFIICIFLHLFFYKDFFHFVYKQENAFFALRSILLFYILSIILVLAAISVICKKIVQKIKNNLW